MSKKIAVGSDYKEAIDETEADIKCLKEYIESLPHHEKTIAGSLAFLLIDRYETACIMQSGTDGIYSGVRLAALEIDKSMLIYSAAVSAKARKEKAQTTKKTTTKGKK